MKFNSHAVICCVEIFNRQKHANLRMILDTGSTYTLVSSKIAEKMQLKKASRSIHLVTGSGKEKAPVMIAPKFKALGYTIKDFPVIIYDLPYRRNVDGILGINFLKKSKAIIDFSKSKVSRG